MYFKSETFYKSRHANSAYNSFKMFLLVEDFQTLHIKYKTLHRSMEWVYSLSITVYILNKEHNESSLQALLSDLLTNKLYYY